MMIPEQVHKSMIQAGDVIEHHGKFVTLCARDIKRDSFMGITIRGDSFVSGRRPVTRLRPYRTPQRSACGQCVIEGKK